MSVQQVEAYEWACDECGDSGLAYTHPDARELLEEHADDAHAAHLFEANS